MLNIKKIKSVVFDVLKYYGEIEEVRAFQKKLDVNGSEYLQAKLTIRYDTGGHSPILIGVMLYGRDASNNPVGKKIGVQEMPIGEELNSNSLNLKQRELLRERFKDLSDKLNALDRIGA